MTEHIVKLITKTASFDQITAGTDNKAITREDVLWAAAHITQLQFACLMARYVGFEAENAPVIIDHTYNRILQQIAPHKPWNEWSEHDRGNIAARAAWLVYERYASGDRCKVCHGSGTFGVEIVRNADNTTKFIKPRLCNYCEGTGIRALSERKHEKMLQLQRRGYERSGWKAIIELALADLRCQEAGALDVIKDRLRRLDDEYPVPRRR